MKRITTVDELMKWAREANHGVSIARKCDMQDEYAHSTRGDIDAAFLHPQADRHLIIFAVLQTMAYDEVERLLKVRGRDLMRTERSEMYAETDAMRNEIENERAELERQKRVFKESMRTYHRRLRCVVDERNGLQKRIDKTNARVLELQDELRAARKACVSLRDKADRFDAVQNALQIIGGEK